MKGGNSMEMTAKQYRCIELLYQGTDHATICEELKITPKTLQKWTTDSDFKRASVELATQQIGELVPQAVQTLKSIIEDRKAKPETKLHTAKAILDYAKIEDRSDLEKSVHVKVEYV